MPESFKLSVAKLANIPDIRYVSRLDFEAFRQNPFVSEQIKGSLTK
jgi:hypothetical protein